MIWLIRLKWYIVIAVHCKAFYNVALKQDLSYFSQNYFSRFYYNYVHTVLISRNEKWFRFYFCSRLNYQLLTNQEMNLFLIRCFICQHHRTAFWMFCSECSRSYHLLIEIYFTKTEKGHVIHWSILDDYTDIFILY